MPTESSISAPPDHPRLHVVIGCDVDPDGGDIQPWTDLDRAWQGVDRGIPALQETLERDFGGRPLITWCVRADPQIAGVTGAADWLFDTRSALWAELERHGHEIAWHVHLHRWLASERRFVPALDPEGFPEAGVRAAHAAASARWTLRSVRTGWDYQSNELLALLEECGLEIDFSCLPGSFVHLAQGDPVQVWKHDWTGAPDRPYRPARSDYRRAGVGADARSIVELPVTQVEVAPQLRAARYALRAARARRDRRHGTRPGPFAATRRRTVLLAHRVPGSETALRRLAARAASEPGPAFCVTYFHPDELLGETGLPTVRENLRLLERVAREQGVELVYVTAAQAAALSGL